MPSSSSWTRLFATSLAGTIVLSLAVCVDSTDVAAPPRSPQGGPATAAMAIVAADAGSGFTCSRPPTLSYEYPTLLSQTNQAGADCFAWQMFISLNWPASATRGQPAVDAGPADFGAPNDHAAVVWETYKSLSEVFLEAGAPPAAWDAAAPTADCPRVSDHVHVGGVTLQRATTAFSSIGEFSPSDGQQAGPANAQGRNWLADQSGNIVWYEVAIDQHEFDYIVDGGLYSAAGQYARVNQGDSGIDPPAQSTEIKAAWRQLPKGAPTDRYLVTTACIPGPGGQPQRATLGLVGLHIIHKASNQPQWVWATFEQVDNVSADAGASPAFFSSSCDPTAQPLIPPTCLAPDAGGVVRQSCTPNALPAYSLNAYLTDGGCSPYPVQVVRETPIPSSAASPAQQTNAAAQAMIAAQAPQSVFQYYQLINAIWWANNDDPNTGRKAAPLSTVGANHIGDKGGNVPVANTVLETFTQHDDCLTCHVYATIAAGPDGGASPWSSNFSFIYSHAQWPAAAAQGKKPAAAPKSGNPAKKK